MPNPRKISRIIGSDSTSYFETLRSHGNDLETRKLGSLGVDCREMLNGVSWLVNSSFKDRIGRGFYIALWPTTKNGSTTIILNAENHVEYPDAPPRHFVRRARCGVL